MKRTPGRRYPDQAASLEYACQEAKVEVHYCMEQFVNDGSPVSTIVKAVKRTMAAEYSRELSNKVFAGQCRLIKLGFRQGGIAGFGLRRMRVDQNGTPQGILARGQHKSLQTDRVILVPGPDDGGAAGIEIGLDRADARGAVHGCEGVKPSGITGDAGAEVIASTVCASGCAMSVSGACSA